MSTNDKINTLSANLKKIRAAKNLTQEEMAELLEINPRTYQNYEGARSSPPLPKLQKIAEHLKINVNELTGDKDKLESELELKNMRIYATYLDDKFEKYNEEYIVIDSAITDSAEIKDPEKIKKLFERFKELSNEINATEKERQKINEHIELLRQELGLDEEALAPISAEERQGIYYINQLQIINDNINYLIKTEHYNKNKILDQIMEGKLECYKELFTIDELKFMKKASGFLALIKKYVDEEGFLFGYTRDSFVNEIINFYSIEEIGLDPNYIKENFLEILAK